MGRWAAAWAKAVPAEPSRPAFRLADPSGRCHASGNARRCSRALPSPGASQALRLHYWWTSHVNWKPAAAPS
jgi:hypothetical protein